MTLRYAARKRNIDFICAKRSASDQTIQFAGLAALTVGALGIMGIIAGLSVASIAVLVVGGGLSGAAGLLGVSGFFSDKNSESNDRTPLLPTLLAPSS